MKYSFTVLLWLFLAAATWAQSHTYRLVDAESREPVPFATVITGPETGTISNEEGYFTLMDRDAGSSQVRISSLGYRSLDLSPKDLAGSNGTIVLEPAAIVLNEVRLETRVPGVEEIIREVRNGLTRNYPYKGKAYQVFYRESETMQFDELLLELEKASDLNRAALEAADQRLQQLGQDIVKSNARKYLDFTGALAIQTDTSRVLRVNRATELVDHEKGYSMESIQGRAEQIILSHLDSSRTYKVKSGMFKIEDSISLGDEFTRNQPSDSTEHKYLKRKNQDLVSLASWQEGTQLYEFLDSGMYKHVFVKATYFDGNYVYAIAFEPDRRKAKYSGILYVDAATFAVLKADYAFGEGRRGQKVNLRLLLGIKFEENLSRGTVIFRRNEANEYLPYFIQKEYGNYVYLHRDLKFIENGGDRKKVRFDFLMEGGMRQRESALFTPLNPMETNTLLEYQEPKKVRLIKLDRYEATIWEDTQIIEPLEEMKNFRVGTGG